MLTLKRHCLGVLACAALAVPTGVAADPIVVTPTNNALLLANTLLAASSGITVNSATFTGADDAAGTFTGGVPAVGIASGIVLTTGTAGFVTGPNNNPAYSDDNEAPGDADLEAIVGDETFNASTLVIDFTPNGNQVQFSYVFGSEEYNEFVTSQFNDVFAFFVNGVNRALIPGTATPVSITTVHNGQAGAGQLGSGPCTNCQYYVDNATGARDTQLDGFTTVLSFLAPVNPGVSNILRLSIADTSDEILDSAVFLGGGTFQVCGGPGQPPCDPDPDPDPVPEPATLALFGAGLAGAWYRQRRIR
jgi:hypothetical protein